ncbi:hypothetical protein [Lysinibacillus capsici]|uniref:hypothetical protein n=1 Tax=Lysinibacillus capsici TaxID=2115968 RepID=UPI0034E2E94D
MDNMNDDEVKKAIMDMLVKMSNTLNTMSDSMGKRFDSLDADINEIRTTFSEHTENMKERYAKTHTMLDKIIENLK